MKHIFLTMLLFMASLSNGALAVNVKVNADKGINDKAVISRIESNLSALLTEINNAKDADRLLNLSGLNLGPSAKETLQALWVVAHFYCCDDEVTDRLWNFRKSYMVRSIPLIIAPDDGFGDGTYQEAVVEFDKAGNITDFRFSFGSQLGESLEKCSKGDPVDTERKMEILAWCDRLRTAYNEHNLPFMQMIFSDKALIITGRVVTETNREFGTSTQKIVYSKQNKRQYMRNLANCFANNKWIDVQFDEVGIDDVDGGCGSVTRSDVNKNFYGVRLHQKWRSSNYNDDGYIFLLWNFTDNDKPQIEVRTWQPDTLNGKKLDTDEIFSLGDFNNDIMQVQ